MSDIKERRLLAINNFRGLDTENNPTKVEVFRASDGENFLIDSNMLKTRPAIKPIFYPDFALELGEKMLGYYEYQGIKIFVTTNHFYFDNGVFVVNDISTKLSTVDDEPLFIKGLKTTGFDFGDVQPFFQEEKDALFIFCLNAIYVFSYILNENGDYLRYVLYDLSMKQSIYTSLEGNYLDFFNDLPMTYEPTLFIGNSKFEDVNLLSNVSKYKIFAGTGYRAEEKIKKYTLPTHYDITKHGGYTSEIVFYKDKFVDYDVYPVFLGIVGEHLGTIPAGDTEYTSGSIDIENVYYPVADFEYYVAEGEADPAIIKEKTNLTTNDFFNMIVKNAERQTVFEYMMGIISANNGFSSALVNQYVVFNLKIRVNCIYRNATTYEIVTTGIEDKTVLVLVEIKKYSSTASIPQEWLTFGGGEGASTDQLSDPYPSYPPSPTLPTGVIEDNVKTVQITTTPISIITNLPFESPAMDDFVIGEFKKRAANYISENAGEFVDGDYARVKGQFYTSKTYHYPFSYSLAPVSQWKDSGIVTGESPTPSFSNPFDYEVVGPEGATPTDNFFGDVVENSALWNDIYAWAEAWIEDFSLTSGNGFFIARYQKWNPVYSRYDYRTLVIPLSFQKEDTKYYERRYSILATTYIDVVTVLVKDAKATLTLKSDSSAFELTTPDYFYDYQNEPCIDVRIIFNKNPDYNLIAKCRFGINFGRENRLFLTGNPEYPNIDRYNVSNDLLGNNVRNQSYELTYFPSKNYRVIGSKSAINGYVVAADNLMYITKQKAVNDTTLYIRERTLDANGIASFNEYKTSINKTPLNHNCIVRFYNDILMLTDSGLYAIEISSNYLTNERLIKLRSGFINKDLIASIAAHDKSVPFIVENNEYMYLVIDDEVYVADVRYTASNENSLAENVSYEIVKWSLPVSLKGGLLLEEKHAFFTSDSNIVYQFEKNNKDEKAVVYLSSASIINGSIVLDDSLTDVYEHPENYILRIDGVYQKYAERSVDFTDKLDPWRFEVSNEIPFANVNAGDVFYVSYDSSGTTIFFDFTFETVDRSSNMVFTVDLSDKTSLMMKIYLAPFLYRKLDGCNLYISDVYENDGIKYLRVLPYQVEKINISATLPTVFQGGELTLDSSLSGTQNITIIEKTDIEMRWVSAITDFGNNVMEKTTFKMMIYATNMDSQSKEVSFGYKTMRRYGEISTNNLASGPLFNFEDIDLKLFRLASFNATGMTFPMKEHNFLYMQFGIYAKGQVEINAIEIIYKNNRMLKTIG